MNVRVGAGIMAVLIGWLGASLAAEGGPITVASRPLRVKAVRPPTVSVAGPHWKAGVKGLVARSAAARVGKQRAGVSYPPNPVTIEGLLARRAINPRRFDHYHGSLGRILGRAEKIREGLICGPGGGLIYLTPYHRYLIKRRELNPARFDHFHPLLGAILKEDARLRLTPCPRPGDDGGVPGGGGGGGQVVPEPSTILLATIGLGLGGWRLLVRRDRRTGGSE